MFQRKRHLALQIKKNDNIQYKLSDSEEWISATVLGKAGNMTGKNKTWYNVQDHLSNEQKSVDLGRLEWNGIEMRKFIQLMMLMIQAVKLQNN